MSNGNTNTVRIGPGSATLLTILFVILKVTGYIAWSWWWVFSPLWISAILGFIVLVVVVALAIAGAIWADK